VPTSRDDWPLGSRDGSGGVGGWGCGVGGWGLVRGLEGSRSERDGWGVRAGCMRVGVAKETSQGGAVKRGQSSDAGTPAPVGISLATRVTPSSGAAICCFMNSLCRCEGDAYIMALRSGEGQCVTNAKSKPLHAQKKQQNGSHSGLRSTTHVDSSRPTASGVPANARVSSSAAPLTSASWMYLTAETRDGWL